MNRKQVLILAAGVLIVLTLWLVGGSVSKFDFADGRFFYTGSGEEEAAVDLGLPAGTTPTERPMWLNVLFVIFWILLPISIIYLIFDPQSLKAMLARVGMIGFWLFVFMLITRAVGPLRDLIMGQPEDAAAGLANEEDLSALFPNSAAVDIPWWTQWAASVLFLLLIAGAIYWIYRTTQAARHTEPSLEDEIAVEAGQAAAALRQGGVLQEVILRCYQSMSEVLASKQRVPQDALTPREFERELQRAGVVDPHITKLSRLFERVRYGSYQAESEDEAEALSCLEGIEARYRSKF